MLGIGLHHAPLAAVASADEPGGASPGASPRALVLVELKGGNDGLNTVVPYRDARYRALRPKLALAADATLALDERQGLHPALQPLMRYWERGELAIVNGVGYSNPNRSHFRSIDIWETASNADETRVDGWLRPVMAALPSRGTGIKGVALDSDDGPFAGSSLDSVVMGNLQRFVNQSRHLARTQALTGTGNAAFEHLMAVERATLDASAVFQRSLEAKKREHDPDAKRPALVEKLENVARLIALDLGPQVYKVTLAGFDTHVDQAGRHRRLMKQLAQGLDALAGRLRDEGRWSDTLVMTYSEFGRRAAENGSGGTDHGTAAPQFVMGGRVRGGLVGTPPDLGRLVDHDLAFDVDFRRLYATAVTDWLGVPDKGTPLEGFEPMPLIG